MDEIERQKAVVNDLLNDYEAALERAKAWLDSWRARQGLAPLSDVPSQNTGHDA